MKYLGYVLVAVSALLLAGQADAQERMQGKGGKHQRPDFSSIDTNGDGYIVFDEFSSQEIPGGDHQTIFDSMDTDSDGKVSESEFNDHKPPRRR